MRPLVNLLLSQSPLQIISSTKILWHRMIRIIQTTGILEREKEPHMVSGAAIPRSLSPFSRIWAIALVIIRRNLLSSSFLV